MLHSSFLLLVTLTLTLLSLPPAIAAVPRATSRVPIYRPLYPPYHTYAAYKEAILALMEDRAHEDTLRMVVSKETTFDQEHLYLMQLGQWRKERIAQSTGEPSFLPPKTPSTPARRLQFLLSFGEHAREFITIESFFHLMQYVLEGQKAVKESCEILASETDTAQRRLTSTSNSLDLTTSAGYRARWSRFLLDHVDLHLLGVSNPDGKLHIEKSPKRPDDYCWRNTGRSVDLNRNADWEFDGPGSSGRPGHEEYHGTQPFSEAETRFIRDLNEQYRYDAYISVHSGEQQLFVPFVDTRSKQTKRRRSSTDLELKICRSVVDAKKMNGFLHDSGIGYEMNDYSADGTLMDYMAGKAEVPLVFCVELWGGPIHNDCFVQFNPDPTPSGPIEPGRTQARSPLERDLDQMHVFYIELFNQIIEERYGVKYVDPIEMEDEAARRTALQQAKRLCEVEKFLYDAHADHLQTHPRSSTSTSSPQERVQMQA